MATFNEVEFNKNLEKLNKNLERHVSFPRNITMAIVKGAAGAIGATIVAGIIIALLAHTLGGVPAIKNYIDKIQATQSQDK